MKRAGPSDELGTALDDYPMAAGNTSMQSLAAGPIPRNNPSPAHEARRALERRPDDARFWQWLRDQRERSGPVGELARDVASRPEDGPWRPSVQAYLHHGDAHVREAMDAAIDQFSYLPTERERAGRSWYARGIALTTGRVA